MKWPRLRDLYTIRRYKNAIVSDAGWQIIANAITQSEGLLYDTIEGNAEVVAKAIDVIHADSTSILQYNDENSLACVLNIAYYTANRDYMMVREFSTGKGFADIALIPRPNRNRPAILLELKYDKSAETAITQIHQKNYTGKLKDFIGEVILVGINYDKQTKHHDCIIEKL